MPRVGSSNRKISRAASQPLRDDDLLLIAAAQSSGELRAATTHLIRRRSTYCFGRLCARAAMFEETRSVLTAPRLAMVTLYAIGRRGGESGASADPRGSARCPRAPHRAGVGCCTGLAIHGDVAGIDRVDAERCAAELGASRARSDPASPTISPARSVKADVVQHAFAREVLNAQAARSPGGQRLALIQRRHLAADHVLNQFVGASVRPACP